MPIDFRCTGCRSRLHVPRRWSGNTLTCPKCGTRVVVPTAADESRAHAAPQAFEDTAVERSLASLRVPAAGRPGGVFAEESFALPIPADTDPAGGVGGRRQVGITLSRRALYAYLTAFVALVAVLLAAAFLLGCWWATPAGR